MKKSRGFDKKPRDDRRGRNERGSGGWRAAALLGVPNHVRHHSCAGYLRGLEQGTIGRLSVLASGGIKSLPSLGRSRRGSEFRHGRYQVPGIRPQVVLCRHVLGTRRRETEV